MLTARSPALASIGASTTALRGVGGLKSLLPSKSAEPASLWLGSGGTTTQTRFSSVKKHSFSYKKGRTPNMGYPAPVVFEQLVIFSDGATTVMRTTSPATQLRLTRDVRSQPLWNPGNSVISDNADNVERFRSKFRMGDKYSAKKSLNVSAEDILEADMSKLKHKVDETGPASTIWDDLTFMESSEEMAEAKGPAIGQPKKKVKRK